MSRIPAQLQLALIGSAMKGALFDSPAVYDGKFENIFNNTENTHTNINIPGRA